VKEGRRTHLGRVPRDGGRLLVICEFFFFCSLERAEGKEGRKAGRKEKNKGMKK